MPDDDITLDADDHTMDADDDALDRIRRLAAAAEPGVSDTHHDADDAPTVKVGDGDLARLRRLAAEAGTNTDDLPTPPAGTRRIAPTPPAERSNDVRDGHGADARPRARSSRHLDDLDGLDVGPPGAARPRPAAQRPDAPWRPPVRSMRPVEDVDPTPTTDHRWKYATVALGVVVIALVVFLVVRGDGDAPGPTDDTVPGDSTPTTETDDGPVELDPDVGGAGG